VVPRSNQIYFNLNAVRKSSPFPSRSTVIVTNPHLEQMGHVDMSGAPFRRRRPSAFLAIPDAEPEVKVSCREWRRSISTKRPVIAPGRRVRDRRGEIMKLK